MAAESAANAAGQATTTTQTWFAWEHAVEPWHQLLFLLLAIALAVIAWRRYGPSPGGVVGLIARICRCLGLIALVVLIAGPSWRTTATSVLPANVLVCVDRSESMAHADGPGKTPRIAQASRLAAELAKAAAVAKAAGHPPMLLDVRSVGGVDEPIDPGALAQHPLEANGASSALADECLRQVASARPDHVVLVSDGRITEGSGFDALAESLRSRGLEISILATGGDSVDPALRIDEEVVNPEVALNEHEPVTVRISGRSLADGPITVRAIVDGEDPVVIELPVHASADPATLQALEAQLEVVFPRQGPAKLRIEIEQGKLHADSERTVDVRERKLQVLLLEGKPRWETRYLQEALKRDPTITLHAWLGDGRWRRWSSRGPDHLPLSANEIKDYDVIIIGDIDPSSLPDAAAAMDAIDKAVRVHGSGLIWLPGESGAIAAFAKQKLGALIPATLPDAAAISRGYLSESLHRFKRAPAADSHGLLDVATGDLDWSKLSELHGALPLSESQIERASEVLATDQDGQPLVVSRDYLPGRALLIAFDDAWRWRRNAGDHYLHRFHSQLLRYVAAGRRTSGNAWRVLATPRRAVPGELIGVSLSPTGPLGDAGNDYAGDVVVKMIGPDGREPLIKLAAEHQGGFSAHIPAPVPGNWKLVLVDGPDVARTETAELVVLPPSDEERDPRADRPALSALARATGGQMFDDPAALVAALPDKSKVREEELPAAGLWDSGYAFLLVLALFAIEWAARRLSRLP